MSLSLLYPAALAALLALIVPLLLHLARRPQQRSVDFAALRWIAAVQRPQRRLVFEERLLLALRVLLLAMLALLLAMPVLQSRASDDPWVVVAPGVDPDRARNLSVDDTARWHWLAAGFPPVGEAVPDSGPTASLLRELDARLPPDVPLTVVVPPVLVGLDGARPVLGREVSWHVVDAPTIDVTPAVAPPTTLAARFPEARSTTVRYLAAAVAAWQIQSPGTPALDAATDTTLPEPPVSTLAWLHPGPLPVHLHEWVEAGHTVIVEPDARRDPHDAGSVPVWHDENGNVLARARRQGAGRVIELAAPLQPDSFPIVLDPGFPVRLRAMLQSPPAPDSAPARAHAPLRAPGRSGGDGLDPERRPLVPWLALAIALLVLTERVLATRSQRWRS